MSYREENKQVGFRNYNYRVDAPSPVLLLPVGSRRVELSFLPKPLSKIPQTDDYSAAGLPPSQHFLAVFAWTLTQKSNASEEFLDSW